MITLNRLDPENLFDLPNHPNDPEAQIIRRQRIKTGPLPSVIRDDDSAVTAKKIKVSSAINALNYARARALDKGQFTLLGPEHRVIQPWDWQKAIKPDSVVEIAFDDPQLETENLKKVDGGYVSPHLEGDVFDRRPSVKRALSRLSIR